MTFNSLEFVAFFALILGARLSFGRTGRGATYLGVLVAGSLVFYAWHVPWYLALMLFTTVLHFWAGCAIAATCAPARRRLLLAGAVATSIGVLAVFKYGNFVLDSLGSVVGLAGLSVALPHLGLVLPIGISFYTFHALSYTIDVYRRRTPATGSFWHFLLYMAFFPQLVAGPIVRARDFLYQIDRKRSLVSRTVLAGGYLCVRGFFFKLVVADNLAFVVDKYWKAGASDPENAALPLLLVFMFSMQIYADFLGYTDIARGIAYLLGFRLPLNFNYPYIAASFSDFWRRWHISLSSWLRDYLYVPLGGNRKSLSRTYANLLIVMLLGGLWHGAAWTFVVWGGIHGVALAVERALGVARVRPWPFRVVWWLVVQAVVLVAWTFFRAASAGEALAILGSVASLKYSTALNREVLTGLAFTLPVVAVHVRAFLAERGVLPRAGLVESGAWAALMAYLTLTAYGRSANPFIYFQF